MTEEESKLGEKGEPGFKAIIEHSDGSQSFLDVGPEDLIVNERGDVIGVVDTTSKKGDTLVDILDESDKTASNLSDN